jgi:predicted ferric reductase
VFYFAHFSFLALIGATLWHAPSAWYYLLPGIVLYMCDQAVRFTKQSKLVKVSQFKFEEGIIFLGYQVELNQRVDDDNFNEKNFKPLKHSLGQYVFLNVPEISLLEWHPFTISSAPGDKLTTHHIRKMGDDTTFTAKLECLASQYTHKQLPLSDLRISVEV